jgi:hypothetical protein
MRIRTAVAAFAELCLTTRLCDLTFKIGAKIGPVSTFEQTLAFIFINIKKNFSDHKIFLWGTPQYLTDFRDILGKI